MRPPVVPSPEPHSVVTGEPIRVRGDVVERPRTALLSRPVLAAGVCALLVGALEITPGLERYRLIRRELPEPIATEPAQPLKLEAGEAELTTETEARPELAQPERVELPPAPRGPLAEPGRGEAEALPQVDAPKPPVPLVDASGRALDGFYAALARVEQDTPGSLARIVHFGDSIIASDYVSGTLRRKLQDRFGDGGHGFVLVANAWPAYFHNDIERYATRGWKVSRVVGPTVPDGFYGLGGVSFRADPHALARFGTARSGNYGRRASRFVLLYLQEPRGGTIQIRVDGRDHAVVDTSGPAGQSGFYELRVPDGEHVFEIETLTGNSRVFGAVLEREGPGVVLDAIGIQGARIRFLDEQDDAHWRQQLEWRKPDLFVYQFGANESADGFVYPMADYHRTMKQVLEQGQAAVPGASCLVLGAMDRAVKKGDTLISIRVLPSLIEEQRRVAAEVGCAFFDTYAAMGGKGSMARWVKRGLGQADLTHPTAVGAEVIGNWIYRALMEGYVSYKAERR